MTASRDQPSTWRPLGLLAVVVYAPLLLTDPGAISADTKTYLYLDPARLLSRAWSMWDPSIGLGTVSHQSIGYLWPMGPWFWAFERLGVPDWIAQRLWWGSILLAAGAGTAYLLRRFRWPAAALWPAVFTYALSPYVLSLMGRLSGVLLPFAGLPWLLALTIQSVRHRGWRHPALFALAVATFGSVNLTALALVGVAPSLWLVYAALVEREHPPRRIVGAAARMGVLAVAVSAWWLAGLSVQASHGIDIVRYTETAEVVSRTSSAQEVLRGLGYWFFYGGDKLELWIEQSYLYTQRPLLIVLSFAVPVLALLGAAVARWRHRAFFAGLVLVGTFLAVGAHPWEGGPPLSRLVQGFLGTERGLAFRSLPRAVPVVALGLAVLLGAGIGAVSKRRPPLARPAATGACLLTVLVLAPLWQRGMVSENLRREHVPAYWLEAADAIDASDDGTRVLELPGSDFASYRWGMTVDPITPGLVDRPYTARELVPYGTPASANLLNALDLRLQERTLDPRSLAPLARLLRAGDLVVRSDLQYERYNLARPRLVWDLVRHAPGVGDPAAYGPTAPNEPARDLQLQDETWILQEARLEDPPAVALVPVEDVPGIVALRPAHGSVLLSGDGAGIVDAAAAGLIDGRELIRYTAPLSAPEVSRELERDALLLVTDTNRRAGERWSSVRHTRGFTEPLDRAPLEDDLSDNRLPVFPDAPDDTWTTAEHRGGMSAVATDYGNPIDLIGEERATAAIDGDPTTAWRTSNFTDARGERIEITLDDPVRIDRVRLLQPTTRVANRRITEVRITLDGGRSIDVALEDRSTREPGQLVELPPTVARSLSIELLADTAGDRPRYGGVGSVGFAEVRINDDPTLVVDEVVRMPTDLLRTGGERTAARPLAYLLTRLRHDPAEATRDDEEQALVRTLEVPTDRGFAVLGTARLSARATDAVLDELLGQTSDAIVVTASSRLVGSRVERASAALDGDPATAWTSRRGTTTGTLTVDLREPLLVDGLDLAVVADGRHSVPTALEVSVDGGPVHQVDLQRVEDGAEPGTVRTVRVDLPPTTGTTIDVAVTDARELTSTDWDSRDQVAHPIAIAELGLPNRTLPAPPEQLSTGCRDDLLTIDGEAVPVRVDGLTDDALRGEPLEVAACTVVPLPAGPHDVRAAAGRRTGIDLDQLVLRSGADATSPGLLRGETTPPDPGAVEVLAQDHDHLRVRVTPAGPGPTWLVLGQSLTDGWTATVDGASLGPPQLVDGFANGWLLPAGHGEATVELQFVPQERVDLALRLSLLSALLCLVLLTRRPQADSSHRAEAPEVYSPVTAFRYVGPLPSRRLAATVALAVTAGASLVVHPVAAIAVGGLAAIGCRHETARRWLTLLPAGLLGASAVYALVWQVRFDIPPGIEWPGELSRAHPVAVVAVLVLLVDAIVARAWSGPQRPSPGGRGSP